MHFEPFEDKAGKWWWRFVAANGQTQFTSHQDFATKSNAVRAARRVSALMVDHPPVVL